jgi:hypothetical protein
MEIKRRFVIENPLDAAGYRILPVAEIYTSWTAGKGIWAFFDKKAAFVVMKPQSGEIKIMDVNGKVLTFQQATDMVPGLKGILQGGF